MINTEQSVYSEHNAYSSYQRKWCFIKGENTMSQIWVRILGPYIAGLVSSESCNGGDLKYADLGGSYVSSKDQLL